MMDLDQNDFTITKSTWRLMDLKEVKERMAEHAPDLSKPAKEFILGEFERCIPMWEDRVDFWGDYSEDIRDRITGDFGRIALGQTWENQQELLGEAMGYSREEIWDQPEELHRVFDLFFTE
jgi:hypothetical protein